MSDTKTSLPKETSLQGETTNPSLPTNPSLRGGTSNSNQSLRGGTTKQSLTPELRFQEFDDSWTKKDFGTIVEKTKAKHDPQKSKEEYPCIEMESIAKESSILLEVFNSKNQLSIKNKFNKGEVLFGKLRPNLKKYIIAPFDGVCSSEIWVLKSKELSNEFLFRLIQTNKFYSSTLVTSGSKMPRADWAYISSSIFPFPSLPEQQKIASFLSSVDKKIQLLTKKKSLLEDYKKGVMQQLFSGELRFKPNVFATAACLAVTYDEANSSNKTEYPEWKWVGGNVLFDNISDKKHNSDLPILAITQDQGAIPRDLINYKMIVTEKSVASYKVVQIGDFVISLRTFQGGIEFSDYHGICSPAYIILRPSSEDVNRDFYKYYLKTSNYIKQLQKNLEGIRDGKMISYKYFSEIKVPFPSYNEQQKIASYLSAIDRKIEAVNNQISQTQSFKKGLLQKMFV